MSVTAFPYALRVGRSEYRVLRWPSHPLASRAGYVAEHRAVWFENAGPGPYTCHWCGKALRLVSEMVVTGDVLVVDHLDGDRLNNSPENLVASCTGCNVTRGRHPGLIETCLKAGGAQ